MSAYNLSYVIATRNRLPFLKTTLGRLISNLQPGEEIVVVDGNSTDGAKEYLQQLFADGRIHQFISEPDHNQAHGWNKAMLMARGTIIKKIIDDDVPCFSAIRKCSNFMLQNPQVDLCISNALGTDLSAPKEIRTASRLAYYEAWRKGETPCFTFGDVYLLIRKSSLSYLGLYDTQFTMMDWEYSLRCSYLKTNIAYYMGYNAMSVHTPGNVTSITTQARLKKESEIGRAKYNYKGDRADISLYSELKIAIGKAINYKSKQAPTQNTAALIPGDEELSAIYDNLYKVIEEYNQQQNFTIISY